MQWPVTMFRLVPEPTGAGLYCGKDGISLGGVPLLTKVDFGFEPLPAEQLQQVFDAAYGPQSGVDAESRLRGLSSAARALNDGNLSHAMIASLQLKLSDIDADGMVRLARTKTLIKFNYNNGENRDWHGRWANGSAGSRNPLVTPVQTLPFPGVAPTPAPFGGGLPGRKPSKDDDYTFPPTTGQPANDNAQTNAQSQAAANDNNPKACPEPSFELDSIRRTREQLLYQAQINKLPLGWGVNLNGIQYDGCRDSDQTMLEAKFGGNFILNVPEDIRPKLNEYIEIMKQATRQNDNSGGRIVEWHFSDEEVATYYEGEFLLYRLFNIRVVPTPYDEFYNYNLIRYNGTADLRRS